MRMPAWGCQDGDDQLDHLLRRVKLAALLAGVVGELLDQVFVGAPQQVGLGQVRVAQVHAREMLNQARQDVVAVAVVAQLALVVVVDTREHAFQGLGVGVFQGRARLVQGLADVGRRLLQLGPAGLLRHEEIVLVGIFRVGVAVALEGLAFLLEAIRQALEEQQAQDVVLVVAGIDAAAKDVGRGPQVAFQLLAGELFVRGQGRPPRSDAALPLPRCLGRGLTAWRLGAPCRYLSAAR
jgi:hypothetical protein